MMEDNRHYTDEELASSGYTQQEVKDGQFTNVEPDSDEDEDFKDDFFGDAEESEDSSEDSYDDLDD